MSLTFYTNRYCPYAQRVAITLRELGLKWKEEEIDLKNKPDWFIRDVNPIGKVPVLKLADGTILNESAVITEYLIEEYGQSKGLLPSTPLARAQGRLFIVQWDKVISAIYDQLRNIHNSDKAIVQAKKDALNAEIQKADEILTAQSPEGPFLSGNQLTLPDIIAAPFATRIAVSEHISGEAFGKDSIRYQKWVKALAALPSVKETETSIDELAQQFKERFVK